MAVPSMAAAAQPCPAFDGAMSFPDIQSPENPEDYCWEVQLGEGQELRQWSETEATVFYESGHEAFTIKATPASDAIGTTVPTTLTVTKPNLITLTVHHRAGNPGAGGAAFAYPVVNGPGWAGGFEPVQIKGPPDESELKLQPLPPPSEEAPTHAPTCEVPDLQGRTLKSVKRALHQAGCKLGLVHGDRHPGARIVKQYRPAYTVRPAGSTVGVRLGR
jgi:hypothetical protein